MCNVTFVIDESGAKGYADKRENVVGELGVVAGYFIPNTCLPKAQSDLSDIAKKYRWNNKCHIADLDPNHQDLLRSDIFAYLLSVQARWTYEAMYVDGFHSGERLASEIIRAAKERRSSNVRVSRNKREEALLHVELFKGAFGKAMAFCVDNFGQPVCINVMTDKVGKSTLNKFHKGADRLLSIGNPKITKVSGFDPDTGAFVKGTITSEITDGAELLGDFSGVQYGIEESPSVLTLAADVLANSVHHYLRLLQKLTPGCPLNTARSISGHPLSSIAYDTSVDGVEASQVADTIFRHPNRSNV